MIHRTMAFGAARLVKAGQHGDAFQQRGFARPVLADDDGDWPVETQFEVVAQERQVSARKNQPLVIFGNQLARSALDSSPPITSNALE